MEPKKEERKWSQRQRKGNGAKEIEKKIRWGEKNKKK